MAYQQMPTAAGTSAYPTTGTGTSVPSTGYGTTGTTLGSTNLATGTTTGTTTGATGLGATGTGTALQPYNATTAAGTKATTGATGTTGTGTTTGGTGPNMQQGAMQAFRAVHHPDPLVPAENPRKNKLALILGDIFVPPLGVWYGTNDLCETGINTVLWCFGIVPAIVHSFLVSFTGTRCSCAGPAAAVPPGTAPTAYPRAAAGTGSSLTTAGATGATTTQPLLTSGTTASSIAQPVRPAGSDLMTGSTLGTNVPYAAAGGAPTSQSVGEPVSFPVQTTSTGMMAPKLPAGGNMGMQPALAQPAMQTSSMMAGTGTRQF